MNFGKLFRFWFPVFLYSGIIFWASSVPSVDTAQMFPHADKLIHFIEYGIYGFLVYRALKATININSANQLLVIAVIVSMLYGISDEFHQTFVQGRSASVADVVFDTIGALFGSYAYLMFNKNK